MFRKLLVTGGVGLLTVSALGVGARAQEQSRAPVPTTPTTLSVGVERSTDTTTTTAATGTTGMAGTGPHDYVAWVSLAGVLALAMGASMRGRRADGQHWG
ncbi:MAG: hypothetical protein QOG90_21 [Actinomycetota bacterium]|jgi:hypothetical protein